MSTVFIFLETGFEEIEALATIDILRRGGVSIRSVSLTGEKVVTGGHQISVLADDLFEEINFSEAQMLILPGGTVKINEHAGLKQAVRAFAQQGKLIAAICAAPMVLGELGLLNNKEATCYPGFEKYLVGSRLSKATVVTDGNITTGMAAGYTIEFALELLSRLKGKEVANDIKHQILPTGQK